MDSLLSPRIPSACLMRAQKNSMTNVKISEILGEYSCNFFFKKNKFTREGMAVDLTEKKPNTERVHHELFTTSQSSFGRKV